MQALLDMMDRQLFGNTVEAYLISAAVFFGVLIALPIGRAIILRHLKAFLRRRRTTLMTYSMICFDASSDRLSICSSRSTSAPCR